MRVGVFGAGGRMGSAVCRAVADDPDLDLVAAVDPYHAGIDVRLVAGVDVPGQIARHAEALERAGASRMVLQQEATGERLAREISELVENPDRVTRMEAAARSLARGDAAAAAVDLMEKLVEARSQESGVRS